MQALVKVAPGRGNVEVREIQDPTPGPGEVILDVSFTGICGTDLHIYLDEYRCVPPVVLGHELSGRVAALGAGVDAIAIGDRVTTETYFSVCGRCIQCLGGRQNLCPARRSIGTHVNGGFARYVRVPAHRLHRVPDGLSLESAAMTEPLSCCVHALYDLAHIRPGDWVLVSGPGPIGLLCLQTAMAAGARTIICGAGGDAQRLDIARRIGADHAIDVTREPLAEMVQDLTGGDGPPIVVEAAGAAPSLRQCLHVVQRGGTVVQIGLYGRPVEADVNLIPMKELRYLGSFAHVPSAWERSLALMARGAIKIAPLITGIAPITAWENQFHSLLEKEGCKVLLTPVS